MLSLLATWNSLITKWIQIQPNVIQCLERWSKLPQLRASACDPPLSNNLKEEPFYAGPWATTSLWADQTGNSSCCSSWTRTDRTSCAKGALHCRWGAWSHLESLAENVRSNLRLTIRVLELGMPRIRSPLHPDWKRDASRLWGGSNCFRSCWNRSMSPLGTVTACATLDIQRKPLIYISHDQCYMD